MRYICNVSNVVNVVNIVNFLTQKIEDKDLPNYKRFFFWEKFSTRAKLSLEEEAIGIALVLHPEDGEKITKHEHHKPKPNHWRHCGKEWSVIINRGKDSASHHTFQHPKLFQEAEPFIHEYHSKRDETI